MIHIFDVALAHFDIADGKAVAVKGIVRRGKISQEELRELLQVFRQVDPVQDFEAEPEMIIATRADKWAVRSDLHRLILYDLHKLSLPGMVCTVDELLFEVNESAQAERRAHVQQAQVPASEPTTTAILFGETEEAEPALVPGPDIGSGLSARLVSLLAAAFLLVCLAVYVLQEGDTKQEAGYSGVEGKAERELLIKQVAGVYMTGTAEGQHGIVVQQDGALKIFQLNGKAPPSFVNDAYTFCRKGGYIWLATRQPGGFVRVLDKDTLEYCSEHYKRVQ